MKKIIAALMAVLIATFCVIPVFAAEETDFVPVLRFIASSDTHIQDDNDTNALRIGKMLSMAYDIADKDENYNGVDALLVAGDLTNDGTKTEFDKFWKAVSASMRAGTQFLGVVAKNHDGYELSRTEMRSYYEALTGNTADFHKVINGFHFIGVSVSENKSSRYDKEQQAWLKEQLDEAVKDGGDKPIFIMHHEHVKNTVYGSSSFDGWGVKHFSDILKDYPQVVDFSGHSHYPINDPRSVWQGEFTAVGTGAIHYAEFTVGKQRKYHPDDRFETATCWIVEADAENNIRLRGMDVNEEKVLCEYILDNPANADNRDYTPEKLENESKPPVFADNAKITVTSENEKCTVTFSAAESTDGMPVILYRVSAKNKLGITVVKAWTLSEYYRAIEQDEVTITLEGLSSGEYTFSIVAENAYGGQSQPIEATASVEGKGTIAGFFTRIKIGFKSAAQFIAALF